MTRWILRSITIVAIGALLLGMLPGSAPAEAMSQRGKTIVLLGNLGANLGETPWQVLRQQLTARGFPEYEIIEFQYAGGSFGANGAWNPNPGGMCESFSKASFLNLRQLMVDLKRLRPNNEVFLVGNGLGGFVATQALWGAAFQQDDPEIWSNLSGIASISGPMAGLSTRRTVFEYAYGGQLGCQDQSMVHWQDEVGDPPERYAQAEQFGAAAVAMGYKIGSFGNTVDCAYRYVSPDICPKVTAAVGGNPIGIAALGDERNTMFVKTGTMWKEYNITGEFPGDIADNHSAMLLPQPAGAAQPMADVAEFVLSQTR